MVAHLDDHGAILLRVGSNEREVDARVPVPPCSCVGWTSLVLRRHLQERASASWQILSTCQYATSYESYKCLVSLENAQVEVGIKSCERTHSPHSFGLAVLLLTAGSRESLRRP